MNMNFWQRLKFLFDPGYLQLEIYQRNYRLIEELGNERRKLDTEKKYTWARVRKLQEELTLRDQEILRLTRGDDSGWEELMRVRDSVIKAPGTETSLALDIGSSRGGARDTLSV